MAMIGALTKSELIERLKSIPEDQVIYISEFWTKADAQQVWENQTQEPIEISDQVWSKIARVFVSCSRGDNTGCYKCDSIMYETTFDVTNNKTS